MPERLGPKLLSWASQIDPETRRQAERTATLPFVHPHVALMADAHLGKGATVGSVIPTERALIPAAVGVDIGCGMIAVRTQWTEEDLRAAGPLSTLRHGIEAAVPLSAGRYNRTLTASARERADRLAEHADAIGLDPTQYGRTWHLQLGSLGSGNHFIEVSVDEDGAVWLFLHSGSRGVGPLSGPTRSVAA
jgi:tRNA-splicing ligase RtcB